MSEVKRDYPEEFVGSGELVVFASDYDALAAELATVKKVAYGNIELMEERDTLRAANQRLEGEVARLREALETVSLWRLPRTDQHWPSGGEMSYGACHGSNGERDYMRRIADAALRGNGGDV
jgi:hypothetical protein